MKDITVLKDLVNRFNENISYYKTARNEYNEYSCRTEYIDPLLEVLGWDVSNSKGLAPQFREVIAENYSAKTGRPDYSLTLRGVTKLFVEAKKPLIDILIDSDAALQARKYGWNAGHKVSILTNFEYFVIYDTTTVPKAGERSTVARYKVFHYTEYESSIDEMRRLVSRDSVYAGSFDAFFNETFPNGSNDTQEVDEFFLAQINDWRLALGKELFLKGGRYNSPEILNDVVQDFINQIVFLRICEDRNLPIYHQLKNAVSNEVQLHHQLENLFRKADQRYNSGMFSGDTIIFDLNSNVIKEMIECLYYPQSPYLFNIIEPNMLGKIYELFLTEQIVITDGKISLTPKKDCANKSIVTTPTEIVKYIVEKALTPICEGLNPSQLKELRIADIACGSGIFLEEAFAFIQAKCVEWYSKNDPDHLETLNNDMRKLPFIEKKEILSSCIYGIDIDVHAVEVAKLSLLIKLIEDETAPSVAGVDPILPDLSGNVFHGNSLIGKKEIEGFTLTNEEWISLCPFEWEEIGLSEGFDVIIGNPPYVKTEEMHELLPEIEFSIYKRKYKTAYQQFDKYFIFLERAISKVKDDGYICFILPNKFYKIKAGKKIRGLIADGKMLVSLDDFGHEQLFEDKTNYTAIILLQKKPQDVFVYSNVESANNLWIGEDVDSIKFNSNTLNKLPWRLSTDFEFLNLLKRMDEVSVPLTSHVNIFNGIQTSAERPPIYWFTEDSIQKETEEYYIISKEGHEYKIEKSILQPFFKPTDQEEKGLNSYSVLSTNKKLIFPYDRQGNLFSMEEMEKRYPGAFEYLNAYYDKLAPKTVSPTGRRDVPNATKETWYQYGRSQALTAFFDTPKLIVGILSKEPLYAYDEDDMFIASGGTAGYCAISAKSDSPYELEYLQAWLTNPYTEKILEIIGSDFEGGYFARGTFALSTLPFVELDLSNPTQKALYDRVVTLTREIYHLNKSMSKYLSKSEVIISERRKKELALEIEALIGRVYRLEF